MRLPLIFFDVDGVLIPFRGRSTSAVSDPSGNPLLGRLDPDDGRRLLALPGELVWASTWMAEANEVIAPRLGLPAFPVVDWPDSDELPGRAGDLGDRPQRRAPQVHWKTAYLTRWAAGRPFVWVDDEPTEADRRWIAEHYPAPALVHHVDPYVGLTGTDFDTVRTWLVHLQ